MLDLRNYDDSQLRVYRDKQRAAYKVDTAPGTIAGVGVQTFTPREGGSPENRDRILINLHAGSFLSGAVVGGEGESIPIAATGRIKVVSLGYRLAPEYRYPAATEDVIAGYRELLKTYKPENIEIYGCSAGATLTAEVTITTILRKLPRPGAIAMICGTGEIWGKGDAAYSCGYLTGISSASVEQDPKDFDYFDGADLDDPGVFPMRLSKYLPALPFSLLISGTRSFDVSTVSDAHNKLVAAGTRSEMSIWDGVMHYFVKDPTLPESREAYGVIARFFARNLGQPYSSELNAFLAEDLARPPEPCGMLFAGSSSSRLWRSITCDRVAAQMS